MEELDWKNSSTRDGFEKGLKTHKERKKDWGLCQNIRWFVEIVIFQFLCMATLYGGCAYMIREKAIQEKDNEEQKMKEDFILLYKEVKFFDFFFNSCKISSLIFCLNSFQCPILTVLIIQTQTK